MPSGCITKPRTSTRAARPSVGWVRLPRTRNGPTWTATTATTPPIRAPRPAPVLAATIPAETAATRSAAMSAPRSSSIPRPTAQPIRPPPAMRQSSTASSSVAAHGRTSGHRATSPRRPRGSGVATSMGTASSEPSGELSKTRSTSWRMSAIPDSSPPRLCDSTHPSRVQASEAHIMILAAPASCHHVGRSLRNFRLAGGATWAAPPGLSRPPRAPAPAAEWTSPGSHTCRT